jgi:hypothetical protein
LDLVTLSFTLIAGNLQFAALMHLVQAMHAGGGFFGHALDVRQTRRIPGFVDSELGFDGGKQICALLRWSG